MEPIVQVDDLTVRKGTVTAVDGATLTIPAGSITGLLGPSGSGKTTLMRSIIGSQLVTSGRVTVLGHPAGSAPLRGRIGYMSQSLALYADLTVRENLRYFASLLDLDPSHCAAVTTEVDLDSRVDTLVRHLSGGEANRASLAVALLARPPLLVLDEPTVGLDPILRRSLWALFRSLAADGTAVLVSSHVMDEAARCDRLVLLRSGRVRFSGTLADLHDRAATDDLEEAFIRVAEDDRP